MQAAYKLFLIVTASFTLLFGVLPNGTDLPQIEGADPSQQVKGDETQAVIVGKIVDEAKKPVAGATVTALNWKKSQPVKSGVDGSFRVASGQPRQEYTYAQLLAQGTNGELGFLSVQQSKPAPVEVVVKAPQEVTVRVTAGDGKPVGGAEVYVQASYSRVAGGRTDAGGQWVGRIPVDAANAALWGVFALKGNVGFDYVVSTRPRGREQPKDRLPGQVSLKLDGARTLRVKTVDTEGKPIAGVKVGPWYIHKPDREEDVNLSGMDVYPTTGTDGLAVFDWLPERFRHAVPILAHSEDYYSLEGSSNALMEEKPAKELTITLLPLESLSGRVTHADGKPAAGIRVRATGQGAGHIGFNGTMQTDADGRYAFKVYSEQAYIVAIADEHGAAPYRGGLVVRAGKPVGDVDFVLGPATRVHGRVTLEKDDRAVSDVQIMAKINLGEIPRELRKKGDMVYHEVSMFLWVHTEKDGRFELFLGPGEYELLGPVRTKMVKITIPAKDQPREIVQDFRMPRRETGTLAGRVVDEKGRPIPEAVISGYYASVEARRWFRDLKTGADGKFQVERSLDPLVLRARTSDGKVAGVARLGAEIATVEIACRPVAGASGRLLDLQDKPLAQAKLRFGIRIYQGEEENSPWMTAFGGTAVTDREGRFVLNGLVVGEKYSVDYQIDDSSSSTVTTVKPKDSTPIALGTLRIDLDRFKPYVPPTPAELAAKAFGPSKPASPLERKEKILVEAKREYTRPLLLFGQPKDAACIHLFRLFNEEPAEEESDEGTEKKQPRQSPRRLRWEFELATLDVEQPEVRKLAETLGVKAGKDRPPVLAVLNADGRLSATYELSLGAKQQLDSAALTAFLLKHKPATRDAEQMLAEALKKAKAEDKRVFFISSASWCGPCRMLGRFLEPWKTELNRHYVFVKLDVSRDEYALAVTQRYQKNSDGGVPWYAILDSDGKALITSNAPDIKRQGKPANIGFPEEAAAVEHFLKMLSQTAPRLDNGKLAEIRETLVKSVQKE